MRNPIVMSLLALRGLKLLWSDPIRDMLEDGVYREPTVYDDLPRGVRVLSEVLRKASDLTPMDRVNGERWIRAANVLLSAAGKNEKP